MNERLQLNFLLLAFTLLSVAMLGVRMLFSGESEYLFLVWNLFLALIPLGISTGLSRFKTPAFVFYPLGLLWLLFFPNAPYVLTDLIHLREHQVPIWYDLIMFLSFAWTSLMFGFVSLADMQQLIRVRFKARVSWLFVTVALALGSYGIYLGRFLRWNSWDVAINPQQLLLDVIEHLSHPLTHLGIFAFTFLMTAFLLLAYLTLHFFRFSGVSISALPNKSPHSRGGNDE
jgi:uncharacterized membrane protein